MHESLMVLDACFATCAHAEILVGRCLRACWVPSRCQTPVQGLWQNGVMCSLPMRGHAGWTASLLPPAPEPYIALSRRAARRR